MDYEGTWGKLYPLRFDGLFVPVTVNSVNHSMVTGWFCTERNDVHYQLYTGVDRIAALLE